jgi:hypothetical protein
MRCEQARAVLHAGPEGIDELWLRLHLWRCAACQAEAQQVRALEEALSSLPRVAPPSGLLPTVLSRVGVSDTRRERKVRRFALAVAFLVLMGLMAAGVFTKSRPPDGRSLLISAAQAMEEAEVIHVVGRPGAAPLLEADTPGGGGVGVDSESWYTTRGFRETAYEDGILTYSLCGDATSGVVHRCLWGRQLVLTYHVGPGNAHKLVDLYRQRLLKGSIDVDERMCTSGLQESTTRVEVVNGSRLNVVWIPTSWDDSGAVVSSIDHYLDARTGHLLAIRTLGPDAEGRPVVRSTDLQYGTAAPPDLLAFRPKPGFQQQEGHFRLLDGGYIHFGVPGDGTDPAEHGEPTGAPGGGMSH